MSSKEFSAEERQDLTEMNTGQLLASLVWGAVGTGYFIYGRKQQAGGAMIVGAVLISASYFVESWIWMSLICGISVALKHWKQ